MNNPLQPHPQIVVRTKPCLVRLFITEPTGMVGIQSDIAASDCVVKFLAIARAKAHFDRLCLENEAGIELMIEKLTWGIVEPAPFAAGSNPADLKVINDAWVIPALVRMGASSIPFVVPQHQAAWLS